MRVKWEPSLSTGVGEIDSQHREFIANLNAFADALEIGIRGGELKKIFDFAVKYAVEHFMTEETYMISYAYPGYKTHKKLHEDFKESFESISGQIETEGWTKETVSEMHDKFTGWFVNHIRVHDAALGDFLKNKMKGG